jgi:hypothetical protein
MLRFQLKTLCFDVYAHDNLYIHYTEGWTSLTLSGRLLLYWKFYGKYTGKVPVTKRNTSFIASKILKTNGIHRKPEFLDNNCTRAFCHASISKSNSTSYLERSRRNISGSKRWTLMWVGVSDFRRWNICRRKGRKEFCFRTKIIHNHVYSTSARTLQETHIFLIMEANRLLLFTGIIAVYIENYTILINSLCTYNLNALNFIACILLCEHSRTSI